MRRRRLLALLSATTAAGVAGCLGDEGTTESDPGGTPDSTAGTEPGGTPDATTDGGPSGDGPSDLPGVPPGEAGFPPDADDVDRVVWTDDVADQTDQLVLDRAVASTTLPDASATFTLHNRGDRRFHTNFYDWALYRRENERWNLVAPRFVNQPLMELPPGQSHAWDLSLSSRTPADRGLHTSGTDDVSVRPVGGGTYAFAIDGWFPEQTATPTHEHKTMFATRFELEGPDLTLEPSNAVTSVTRDGDVVRVEATGDTNEDARQATYVLSRASEAEAVHELVTEQAYRQWPLRDALAHAEDGVTEVRLRAGTSTHPAFGVHNDDPPSFTYDGTPWRVTVENVAEDG